MKTNGLTLAFGFLAAFNQVASHVDEGRFLRSCSLEDAASGVATVHHEAAGRKIQVAEKDVIAGTAEKSKSLVGRRRATHPQAVSRQAFLKKHPEAFLIVENQHCTACEKIGGRSNFISGNDSRFLCNGNSLGVLRGRNGQVDREGRSTGRKNLRFDVSTMLANDGHANAKPEAGASAGTLGGVEGIKYPRKGFRTDADAVILDGDRKLVALPAGTNLNAASVTHLPDSLFGIGDEVQKYLNQLVGVPNDARKIRL